MNKLYVTLANELGETLADIRELYGCEGSPCEKGFFLAVTAVITALRASDLNLPTQQFYSAIEYRARTWKKVHVGQTNFEM